MLNLPSLRIPHESPPTGFLILRRPYSLKKKQKTGFLLKVIKPKHQEMPKVNEWIVGLSKAEAPTTQVARKTLWWVNGQFPTALKNFFLLENSWFKMLY